MRKIANGSYWFKSRRAIEKGWDILALEVASDHIHLFISVKPTDTPHLIIKAFKGR